MSVLCLGPKYSGKTHLLTKLTKSGENATSPHIVPTIGTNIFSIKLPAKQKTTTTKPKPSVYVQVREVGGTMAPMWKNYLTDVRKLMYVVDTSNLCQISAAGTTKTYTFPFYPSHEARHFRRRSVVLSVGWSPATACQSDNCPDEDGSGVQTNAQRGAVDVTIGQTEEANPSGSYGGGDECNPRHWQG